MLYVSTGPETAFLRSPPRRFFSRAFRGRDALSDDPGRLRVGPAHAGLWGH
jgi:hypothetical protein